jgi:hypothetical protein
MLRLSAEITTIKVLNFLFCMHKKKKAEKKAYSHMANALIIKEALLLKTPSKKSEIKDINTYKKITLSSIILLILL